MGSKNELKRQRGTGLNKSILNFFMPVSTIFVLIFLLYQSSNLLPFEFIKSAKAADNTSDAAVHQKNIPQAVVTNNPPQSNKNSATAVKENKNKSKQAFFNIKIINDRIRSGESLFAALKRHKITNSDIFYLTKSLKKRINFKALHPGDTFTIEQILKYGPQTPKNKNKLLPRPVLFAFELHQTEQNNAPSRIRAQRNKRHLSDNFNSKPFFDLSKYVAKITVKEEIIRGAVNSTLYEEIIKAGGNPALVDRFTDVFAWQIDFYREARKNDTFQMIARKFFAEGRFIGYGNIIMAEYINKNKKNRAFYYKSPDGATVGMFNEKGESLEKAFLRNPMDFARITSKYGQRFHPILKRRAKHNGVDYGAKRGTPFWSVADGVVTKAKYNRTAGNHIKIRHLNGYETEYFHLQSFAKGIKKGSKVKQRQIIGYVGCTGRCTGPHLHLGMKLNSRYIDPLKQNFPSGKPVRKHLLANFKQSIKPMLANLNNTNTSRDNSQQALSQK